MPAASLSIWDSQMFTKPQGMQPGVPVVLAVSQSFSNVQVRSTSLQVDLNYESISPDITNGSPSFSVGCIIEAQDQNGNWNTIAYQFSPYRNSESPSKRIIRLQPDISDFNAGIDDSIFPIDREIARISRQQGKLPESLFRVSLLLVDNDPEGLNSFQSVTVSASGEQYDHV